MFSGVGSRNAVVLDRGACYQPLSTCCICCYYSACLCLQANISSFPVVLLNEYYMTILNFLRQHLNSKPKSSPNQRCLLAFFIVYLNTTTAPKIYSQLTPVPILGNAGVSTKFSATICPL